MKHVFLGPTHRVQISIHLDPADQRQRLYRVDALPRGAHRSTAFVHGEHLYGGHSATEAWEAVLRLVPRAEVPDKLHGHVAAGTLALPLCPFCHTVIRPHHRQKQVLSAGNADEVTSRPAHAACAADQVQVDPRLLSS